VELRTGSEGFAVWHDGACLLRHTPAEPCFSMGRGEGRFRMHRGNFDISGTVLTRAVLTRTVLAHATVLDKRIELRASPGAPPRLTLHVTLDGSRATVAFRPADAGDNRLWVRLPATEDEHVRGCGERMSYLDLRGRRFPLWTSEPGAGRDKES